MSSSIPIYIVPENDLKAVAGSKDKALFKKITSNPNISATDFGWEPSKVDTFKALLGNPPIRRALRNIVFGRPTKTPSPLFYASAYEILCQRFCVDYFEDWIQVGRAAHWIANVQEAVKAMGLSVDLLNLLYHRTLIDIPMADPDQVNTGYWNFAEVKAYKREIDDYLASDMCKTADDPMCKLDYPLHDMHKWLKRASQKENSAVVAFYF